MFKTSSVLLPLFSAVALGSILACGQTESSSTANQAAGTRAQPPEPTRGVLATVNGIPIGEADVRFALSSGGHSKDTPSGHRKNVVEAIIRRELIYQRAVEMGLDANPRYQEKLGRMEAQINAFKRKELAALFWREIAGRAAVSEAEAKKYFAENAARIRNELHVWQILRRKEGLIDQDLNALKQGTPFDELVSRRFPNLPKTVRAPWDLGYLKWKQVPESWREVVYNLKKGEVSGVIRGPNNRFWIIKLIDNRENPDITFEGIKPTIIETLKTAKIEKRREKIARELRGKASIVYLEGPVEPSDE